MIRINVLPERRARRAQRVLKTFLISLTVLIGVPVVIEAAVWYVLDRRVTAFEQEQAALTQELDVLKAKAKEVANVERDNAAFQEKLKVIEQLKKQQAGPVRLLTEISKALPPRVWLLALGEKSGKVDLEGMAHANADLVDFIFALEQTKMFKEVTIVESRETIGPDGTPMYAFKLICHVA